MDLVILSRLQFGLTNIYHFLFVPLTIGLSAFVAFMQTRYYQTRDETFYRMTRFWAKVPKALKRARCWIICGG